MTKSETWKDVVGYEGLYKVSNKGNVYSVERKNNMGRKCGGRKLRPRYHTNGYLQVDLRKDGIRKSKLIHRLVAEAFIPNPLNKPTVNYLDGDPKNNRVNNLEWATYKENNNHAFDNQLINTGIPIKLIDLNTQEEIEFRSLSMASKFTNRTIDCIKDYNNRVLDGYYVEIL